MFGYVVPDKPYLYLKDDTLYKALYCGICKSIKKSVGQIARFTLSYDMAFMSAIAHNILGVDVVIEKKRCIAHAIKRRPIAKPDEISKKIANTNVLLAYYKLKDDVLDENKGNFKSSLFKKAYKKAKKNEPIIDGYIKTSCENLLKLEKANSDSIDMVADEFASLFLNVSREIFKEKSTTYTDNLMYYVGKWVYLIDALDDYDKDVESKNFNVFYNVYKKDNFKSLVKDNKEDIFFIFKSIFVEIEENFNKIEMKYNVDLVKNIILRGLPTKTSQILNKGFEKSQN